MFPFRGVGIEGFVSGDLGVGVVALDQIVIDDDRECAADDLVVDDHDDLPFGEYANEPLSICFGVQKTRFRRHRRG